MKSTLRRIKYTEITVNKVKESESTINILLQKATKQFSLKSKNAKECKNEGKVIKNITTEYNQMFKSKKQ